MRKIKCPVCGAEIRGTYCRKCGYLLKKPSFPADMEEININNFQKPQIQPKKVKKRKKDPIGIIAILIICIISCIVLTYRLKQNLSNKNIETNSTIELQESPMEQEDESTGEGDTNSQGNEVSIKGVIYKKEQNENQEYMVLVKCNSTKKSVSVESKVDNLDVKEIGEEAFLDCEHLEELHIPEGIEIIRKGAFQNCQKLGLVFFPKSLRKIEEEELLVNNCSSFTVVGVNESYAFEFAQKYKLEWEEVE